MMARTAAELSANDILEKEFKNAMRGYHQEEVDTFLDIIIKDYEFYETELKRLRQENDRLKASVSESKSRPAPNNNQSNYDVLKRLSHLEKAVFGGRINDREM